MQISLPQTIKEPIKKAVDNNNITLDLFKDAQEEVVKDLGRDIFPRYMEECREKLADAIEMNPDGKQYSAIEATSRLSKQRSTQRHSAGSGKREYQGDESSYKKYSQAIELLTDDETLGAVRECAIKLHCEETIDFFCAVQKYRLLFDPSDKQSEAQRIWDKYMASVAVTKVNVDDAITNEISKKLKTMDPKDSQFSNLFDDANAEVLKMIHQNVIPSYLNTNEESSVAIDGNAPVKKKGLFACCGM